jgi:hypothetical protein
MKPRDLLEVNKNTDRGKTRTWHEKGKIARTVIVIKASNKDFDSTVL